MKLLKTSEYIFKSLYEPKIGYFNQKNIIIKEKEPIQFQEIKNYKEYNSKLIEIYSKNPEWMTPSILFQPFYSKTILNYIIKENKGFNIIEIGGGTGQMCKDILNELKKNYFDLYLKTKYKIIEISEELHQEQLKIIEIHPNRFESIHQSIFNWNELINEQVLIIGIEILDNFAHDKILIEKNKIFEIFINEKREEILIELNDPFIEFYLNNNHFDSNLITKLFSNLFKENETKIIYIPTFQLKLLFLIQKYFPNSNLLLADFSHFLKETHYNEPIIQKKIFNHQKWNTIEYSNYFKSPYDCDILFPTNFNHLKNSFDKIMKNRKNSKIINHRDFMLNYNQNLNDTCLKDGYNPILEDYSNFKYFIG